MSDRPPDGSDKGEVHMVFRRLWLIPLLLLVGVVAGAACGGDDEAKGPIVLIEQDWDGQLVTTEVAKIILEDHMGYIVEKKFAAADSQAMFQGMEDGDMHFACCNWPTFSAPLVADYVDGRDTVERVGPAGIIGSNAWYVPTYMIEGDASRGIDAVTPDLASYEQLNKYAELFSTPDTGNKGRFLDWTPAWAYNNQERIESLSLDYEVVYTGSEAATLAEMEASYNRGDPLLFVIWAPHWAHAKYDLTEVGLPAYTDECFESGRHDCGWHPETVAKLAWPGLKDEFPDAYAMLQKFTITNDQQNEMVFAKAQSGKTIDQAARDWIAANESIWRAWLP